MSNKFNSGGVSMIENKDLHGVGAWLASNLPTIYSVGMSISIAALRIAFSRGNGSPKQTKTQTAIECCLCGAITLTLTSGMDVLGIPQAAATLIGGSVGFLGVEKIKTLAERFIDTKVDKSN